MLKTRAKPPYTWTAWRPVITKSFCSFLRPDYTRYTISFSVRTVRYLHNIIHVFYAYVLYSSSTTFVATKPRSPRTAESRNGVGEKKKSHLGSFGLFIIRSELAKFYVSFLRRCQGWFLLYSPPPSRSTRTRADFFARLATASVFYERRCPPVHRYAC